MVYFSIKSLDSKTSYVYIYAQSERHEMKMKSNQKKISEVKLTDCD